MAKNNTATLALDSEPKVKAYGFCHNAAEANEVIGVENCVDDTFYVLFDGTFTGDKYIVDVNLGGHTYSVIASPKTTSSKLYWRLGPSKEDTAFDFVDQQPVAEDMSLWPTVTSFGTTALVTVSTYTGDDSIYPTSKETVYGVDGNPVEAVSVELSTSNPTNVTITPKEDENMSDATTNLAGCQFDSQTAKAVHGKKLYVMVTDAEGTELLGVSGQQGTSFSVEAETSEASTKDGDGEWVTRTAGQKSWSASVDGLWALDDDSRRVIVKALKSGLQLCVGLYYREKTDDQTKYVPVRKGVANVTSDELDAPSDDNATYSINFDGTGELWMIETATPEEIEEMSFTL